MKPITVEELYKLCAKEIKKGNGKKEIAISDDEELNGVHGCYFGFTNIKKFKSVCYNFKDEELKNMILLG